MRLTFSGLARSRVYPSLFSLGEVVRDGVNIARAMHAHTISDYEQIMGKPTGAAGH